jgi:hypothetical protein
LKNKTIINAKKIRAHECCCDFFAARDAMILLEKPFLKKIDWGCSPSSNQTITTVTPTGVEK